MSVAVCAEELYNYEKKIMDYDTDQMVENIENGVYDEEEPVVEKRRRKKPSSYSTTPSLSLTERKIKEHVIDNRDEYTKRDGRTGFWIVGAGAMVNKLPVSLSEYVLPMVYVAYERIQKKALGSLDFSWSFGFYDLMPEAEFAVIIPAKPFDFRVSVGGYYDFIFGGHAGVLAKVGVIIQKTISLDLVMVPIGTQPIISYSESLSQEKAVLNDGEHGMEFPVFGVLLSTRF
jgi:hypothetical protein